MTIESQLQELIDVNKAILVALQSGAQISAAAPAAPTKGPRGKKTDDKAEGAQQPLPVLEGDPEGTRYFVSEEHKQVYAQLPGTEAPKDASFKIESAAHYAEKKQQFELTKNALAATTDAATTQANAGSAPSATAQADTASAATSGGEVDFDTVVKALKDLAGKPEHGATAVKAVMTHFDETAANVNALKALNKNAEILAHVNKLLNPGAAAGNDALFG